MDALLGVLFLLPYFSLPRSDPELFMQRGILSKPQEGSYRGGCPNLVFWARQRGPLAVLARENQGVHLNNFF